MEFEQLVIKKLDKISEDITDLRVVNAEQCKDIARNADDLEKHMKRTDLLEESLELQKKAVNQRFQKLEEPRKFISVGKKYLLWIAGIAGAVYSLYRGWLVIEKFL